MMKKVTAVILAVCMMFGIVGCDSGTGTDTITFSVGNWPKEHDTNKAAMERYENYLTAFNEKYPGYTVEKDYWAYDVSSFLPKAAGGQLPTLYNTFFTEISKITDAGYAKDITKQMEEYGYLDNMNPDLLELVEKDGKYYGIPYNAYVFGLWFNMDLLREAGELDENGYPNYPETYEELAQMAQRIKQKTGKAGFFMPTTKGQGGWQFTNIAWAFGAKFEENVDGEWKAVFNSPEAVAALQWVKDLKFKYDVLQDNVLVDESEFIKLFSTNQVAIGIDTTMRLKNTVSDYKMNKDNIAMYKMPEGPAGRYTLTGGNVYMVAANATDEQADGVFKWLEVSGSGPDVTEEQKQANIERYKAENEQGYIVGPSAISSWTNPERLALEEEAKAPYINVDMKLFEGYNDFSGLIIQPEEPVCTQELYKTLDNVLQVALTDPNSDPQALLDQAVADFQTNYLDKQ